MGMYTELIFGAELKEDTPDKVVRALKYMIGELEERPFDFPLSVCDWLFRGGSYYFAINEPVNKMWHDEITETWHISTRSNIKNYGSDIETFLEWIKPYIQGGSGYTDMYAIVMYEESDKPTIYYLREE